MVVGSIRKFVNLSPIPDIYVKYKFQMIVPTSFRTDDFIPSMNSLTDVEWMHWFPRMELLAQLGAIKQIPELMRQVQYLEELIQSWFKKVGFFTKKLKHAYSRSGARIRASLSKNDWRVLQRRINDLAVRSLSILHYAWQQLGLWQDRRALSTNGI